MNEEPEFVDDGDDDGDEAAEPVVNIEISGLSLYTHHGVGAAEREVGQRLVFDISFDVGDCDATGMGRDSEIRGGAAAGVRLSGRAARAHGGDSTVGVIRPNGS